MSKISELSDGGALQSTDYLIAVRSGGNVKVQPAGMTFSSVTITSSDINGGNIDGTVIGAATPAAGSFTTGQFGTSLNVDGTVTADGLSLDASVNYPVLFENQAGSTADAAIGTFDDANGTLVSIGSNFYVSNAGAETRFNTGEEASGIVLNRTGAITARTSDGTNNTLARLNIANNGDISFYEDTGTTPKFFWDASAESLGIGTTSPASKLHVLSASAESVRIAYDATKTARLGVTSAGDLQVYAFDGSSYRNILLAVDSTTSAGNVGIGTSSPARQLQIGDNTGAEVISIQSSTSTNGSIYFGDNVATSAEYAGVLRYAHSDDSMQFWTSSSERMRIDSGGNLLVGKTALSNTTKGATIAPSGEVQVTITNAGGASQCVFLNREDADGTLILFRQGNATEGSISVSGTTVSYIGGHLSRWSQLPDNTRIDLLKGTVMTNLDQMAVWGDEDNEQLNCMAVSSVEGDPNVAGVFVNWDDDDTDHTNDMNVAMTGDMIIRIAQGTTVQRGDLLMSAGDGTAKPQGDDIVRSKTIAKVTSTHVTCTYADGSYCVPCVLMAC